MSASEAESVAFPASPHEAPQLSCDCPAPAEFQCAQCDGALFCTSCVKVHNKLLKGHLLSTPGHAPANVPPSAGADAMCPRHPTVPLTLFCNDDREIFCQHCLPTSVHFKKHHDIVEVQDAIASPANAAVVDEAKQSALQFGAAASVVSAAAEAVRQQQEQLTSELEEKRQRALTAVNDRFDALKSDITAASGAKFTQLTAQAQQLKLAQSGLASVVEEYEQYRGANEGVKALAAVGQVSKRTAEIGAQQLSRTPCTAVDVTLSVDLAPVQQVVAAVGCVETVAEATRAAAAREAAARTAPKWTFVDGAASQLLSSPALAAALADMFPPGHVPSQLRLLIARDGGIDVKSFKMAMLNVPHAVLVVIRNTEGYIFGAVIFDRGHVLSDSSGGECGEWIPGDAGNFLFRLARGGSAGAAAERDDVPTKLIATAAQMGENVDEDEDEKPSFGLYVRSADLGLWVGGGDDLHTFYEDGTQRNWSLPGAFTTIASGYPQEQVTDTTLAGAENWTPQRSEVFAITAYH